MALCFQVVRPSVRAVPGCACMCVGPSWGHSLTGLASTSRILFIFFLNFRYLCFWLVIVKADESYCIGPAQSQHSYLNKDRILDVAKQTGAQVT